jgi:AcrR family transcriptional regulator
MPRTRGALAADHAGQRAALTDALADALLARPAARLSLRELAREAGVSTPTLRHYFGDRDGVLRAVLQLLLERGAPWLRVTESPVPDAAQSVHGYMRMLAGGLSGPLLPLHSLGLAEGLHSSLAGPGYVNALLEPSLVALERRLAVHARAGTLIVPDARAAAFQLVSPVLVAALHQLALGGRAVRPLDLMGLAETVAEAFLRAHRPPDQAAAATASISTR